MRVRNPSQPSAVSATRATKPVRCADGGWLNLCVSQSST